MKNDDNRTGADKLADHAARAIVLGGFASLGVLMFIGVVTMLRLVF